MKTKTTALFHNQRQIQRGVSHLNAKILTFLEGQIKTLTHGRVGSVATVTSQGKGVYYTIPIEFYFL